jgi:hypothetical protein
MTAKTVKQTCKSCRLFSMNKLLYPRHAEVGYGHCELTAARGKSVFKSEASTCEKYDATDVRKAALAAMKNLKEI